MGLFGGGILSGIAQHIDSRQLEGSQGTHHLAQRTGLAFQGRLAEHMAGQSKAVFGAPLAQLVREGMGEPLRNMGMEMIAHNRYLAVREIPQQFRQLFQKIFLIGFGESLGKIVGPGEDDVLLSEGKTQRLFSGKLWLVGEDGWNGFPEILADVFVIVFMGYLNKTGDGAAVQRVHIGFIVVPGAFLLQFQIGIPFGTLGLLVFGDGAVTFQTAILLQLDVIAAQQMVLGGASLRRLIVIGARGHGEKQMAGPFGFILGHDTTGCSGRPAVLIVEPGQHLFVLGFLHTGFDETEKIVAEIGGYQTGAAVHMKSAEPHLL